MKMKIIILMILSVYAITFAREYPSKYAAQEETFVEEIIGIVRPLLIMTAPLSIPLVLTLLIIGLFKSASRGASLTADLFKDDEDEEEVE